MFLATIPLENSLGEVFVWLWVLLAAIVGFHAGGRGRSGYRWFALTLLGGPISVAYYHRQPTLASDVSTGLFRRHAGYVAIVTVGWTLAGPVVGAVLGEALTSSYGVPYNDLFSTGEILSDYVFFGAWMTVAAVVALAPSRLLYDEGMLAAERWLLVVVELALVVLVCWWAPGLFVLARTIPQTGLAIAYPAVTIAAAGWAIYEAVMATDRFRLALPTGG